MARYLGEIVHYVPRPGDRLFLDSDQAEFAAVVTRVHEDGSADLSVFPPGYMPVARVSVPVGTTHHTHRSIVHRIEVHGPDATVPEDGGA